MTLTTETIKQWRSDAENIARRSCEYETEYSAAEAILALTAELLANREAQPAEWSGWACQFPVHMPRLYGDRAIAEINCDYDGGARLLFLSSAQPASANAQIAGYFVRHRSAWDKPSKWRLWTECSAEDYAEFCKIIASGDADAGRFYEARILYYAPPAPAVPDFKALADNLVENLVDCGGADEEAVEQYLAFAEKACRAAMLSQPVSQRYTLPEGFKLVPVESTDAWAERYCELTNKHPDGGLTTCIGDGAVTITFREKSKREIDAMLAAAPEGGNG
ncbi:hypothetical protein [Serratia marcescens]|uniref:hypothetical protein n=1 Tax=Serratia marcescens TaxID=615 RepID=UPI0007451F1D|nr:hypothetical protein [Serratia marcescens]CVB13021.1 Uncharacterised protein [Serratia marcescens]CVB60801.1 Uncharacterised protein [Serratia marcescens]CVC61480.1 Uncharacterised protein [Serratia marcescens]CVD24948.1 Uncharacterised protein [Serratia marcescens]CVE34536.1 Uncharacterised protein [Serratia marcescens]